MKNSFVFMIYVLRRLDGGLSLLPKQPLDHVEEDSSPQLGSDSFTLRTSWLPASRR